MTFPALSGRFAACAVLLAMVVGGGCGGADARKNSHLQKGHAFLAARNSRRRASEFRNALQIAPNDAEARFDNGVVDEKVGQCARSGAILSRRDRCQRGRCARAAALGRLFVFSGAPERALEMVKPALAAHPDDARSLAVRAAARVQLKDPDGALADAERAVQLAPDNEDAVAVLAGIYKSRNETVKAQALLQDASRKFRPRSTCVSFWRRSMPVWDRSPRQRPADRPGPVEPHGRFPSSPAGAILCASESSR